MAHNSQIFIMCHCMHAVCNHLYNTTPTQSKTFFKCGVRVAGVIHHHHLTWWELIVKDQFVLVFFFFYHTVSQRRTATAAHHSGGQVDSQRRPAQDQRQHTRHHHPAGGDTDQQRGYRSQTLLYNLLIQRPWNHHSLSWQLSIWNTVIND